MTQLQPTRVQKVERPALHMARFQSAEYVFNTYRVVPENETPFEAILDPAYWAHISARLKPSDIIIVEAEDGSYWAQLLVRDAGRLYAKVAVLNKVDFDKEDIAGDMPIPNDMSVKWRGPFLKWSVMRGADVLIDKLATKPEAQSWLGEHLKTMAR